MGRLAAQIATMLQGKDRPTWAPGTSAGDAVIVTGASRVRLTGSKWGQTGQEWYTGFPSGQRSRLAVDVWKRDPPALLTHAVRGMLPRTKMRKQWLRRLRVYGGDEHDFGFLAAAPEDDAGRSMPESSSGRSNTRVGALASTRVRTVPADVEAEENTRPPILDRTRAEFWVRSHRPDTQFAGGGRRGGNEAWARGAGEGGWAAGVAQARIELDRAALAEAASGTGGGQGWRSGLLDYHGRRGGPDAKCGSFRAKPSDGRGGPRHARARLRPRRASSI